MGIMENRETDDYYEAALVLMSARELSRRRKLGYTSNGATNKELTRHS